MRQIIALAIGAAFVWYIVEFNELRYAVMAVGFMVVALAVGVDAQFRGVQRVLDHHARKIFPSLYGDDDR